MRREVPAAWHFRPVDDVVGPLRETADRDEIIRTYGNASRGFILRLAVAGPGLRLLEIDICG